METENNINIAFLDTSVCREENGRLTTNLYRKPTHTDQNLAYDSHHPQSVKRDQAKNFVTKPSITSKQKNHLLSVFISNGYSSSFVQKITKTRTAPTRKPMAEFKSTAILPFIQVVSKALRRSLQQSIRIVFNFDTTLRSYLV